MSSKPVRRKSERIKKLGVRSFIRNKKSAKTLIAINTTEGDVNGIDSRTNVTYDSHLSDSVEHFNKVLHNKVSRAALPAEITSQHAYKEQMVIKNKSEQTLNSDEKISLGIVKEKLNCSANDSSELCQIISEHSLQNLKRVIKHGMDYMKLCGRSNFMVDDFYRGLFVCGEWDADEYDMHTLDTTDNICIEREWLENNNLFSKCVPNIPVELQDYFLEATKVLLNEDEELCTVIWKDLETNSSLLRLVPFFVKFLSECIDSLCCDFSKVSNLLRAMRSLLFNSNLYFFHDSDLNVLAFTLLKFLLLDPPQSNKHMDLRFLKDYAAYLLKEILKKSRSSALMSTVMNKIESFLSDCDTCSFVSQYGAIAAINSIGVIAILRLMPSPLARYFKYISQAESKNDKQDFCIIKEQLVNTHHILTQHFFRYEFCQKSEQHHLPAFLKNRAVSFLSQFNFAEYFGDTLVPNFPFSNSTSFNVHSKKKVNIVHSKKKPTFVKAYIK